MKRTVIIDDVIQRELEKFQRNYTEYNAGSNALKNADTDTLLYYTLMVSNMYLEYKLDEERLEKITLKKRLL